MKLLHPNESPENNKNPKRQTPSPPPIRKPRSHASLERYDTGPGYVMTAWEDEEQVTNTLTHLLCAKPTVVLIASTTAPAGPEDVVGRALTRLGSHTERFLAPVEPGNLLLLAYKDEIPIISAPGCYRSAKPNVVDLILPPSALAKYRVSGWEVACLGHGGLLA